MDKICSENERLQGLEIEFSSYDYPATSGQGIWFARSKMLINGAWSSALLFG
jgi:hypothetical protein